MSASEANAKYRAIEREAFFEQRLPCSSMHQLLCQTAASYGKEPALSFQLEAHANAPATTLSWSDLLAQTNAAANLFRSLGIGENDVVAYMLPLLNETVVTMMAGMTAGIVNPINPLLEDEQIAALLKETNAKVLVTLKPFPKTDLAQKAHNAAAMAPCVETIIEIDMAPYVKAPQRWFVPLARPKVAHKHKAKVLDFHRALKKQNNNKLDFKEPADDRVCAYFHTGGTTGMPKVAQHRQSGVLYNGWVISHLAYGDRETVICPLPFFHVFAAYPAWTGCIASGSHMVLPTPQGYRGDGVFQNFWQLVERWQAGVFYTVPTAAAALIQQPITADISSLKAVVSGSAPFPLELFKRFEEAVGADLLEGYGMTEATCIVSSNPRDGERKPGSVGLPLPYTRVKILQIDGDGNVVRECPNNEVGEICVSNPGVVVGKTYTSAQKNAGLYINGDYLRTGDLGRIDDDGYLWITGRSKDLIIRGGHNIDPAIIEEALITHPAVAFVGAIGQPDAFAGQLPCAYVELNEGTSAGSEELMNFAREHIAERAAVPKYIEVLSELPKTAVGKVFKPDLRKRAITRVYDAALKAADVPQRVARVVDDKKLGLVAELDGSGGQSETEKINAALGHYSEPWRWAT
ncbi:MAG: acyl-CoA synthetase [Gammaproteobacteria bacterium]|nr:acyl-CoA synthetase [Gammaproteobacteria bacterium]MBT8151865.1 acyl-CoA synthetase [Gammaproteobacteria bacterium]NNL10929.1 acyl-CoA synthetase [Pseudomonadales bacterium]NNM10864.1 acyl-CoA synthetase [Pseudomonadales bacterium]